MISAIILSKDRPSQLHLLLESIQRNTSNLFDVTVIYEGSNDRFLEGYDFAQRYFHFKNRSGPEMPVKWKQRTSENLTLDIVECLSVSRNLTCLLNDQNILFDTPPSYKSIIKLFSNNFISCLSLRLGNNTIIQNPYDSNDYFIDKPEKGDFIYETYMMWKASDISPYTNFSIPFSINGHIYYTDSLAQWIIDVEIKDYEDFEKLMQEKLYGGFLEDVPSVMTSLEYSVLIHNSSSKISDAENLNLDIKIEDLNERYLSGTLIDYDFFNFKHISKPFEDFVLRFKHEDYMYYSDKSGSAG